MPKIVENLTNNLLVGFLILALIITPFAGKFSSIFAQSQNKCEKEILDAQKQYDSGRFDGAIKILTECLSKENISQNMKMKAYRLLGLAYIAKDYLKDAKTAVSKLLDIVPNYKPDPEQDPPAFVNIIAEEIKERKNTEKKIQDKTSIASTKQNKNIVTKKEKSSSLWYYIGGGVAAVAVAVVLLLGGGNNTSSPSSNDLPTPPPLP